MPDSLSTGLAPPQGPRQLVRTLAWLRLCAVGGQLLTVWVVAVWLHIAIPVSGLLAGIAALGAFSLFAFWRLARPYRIRPAQALAHVAFDTLVLGYLLYLTGGVTNPFVLLLVMPITLAATALPLRHVAVVALFAVAAFLFLVRNYLPLPEIDTAAAFGPLSLHIAGTAISFAITAATLGYFITRLASALRDQQAEAELERERALRDEGILAIATQAADAAHELNTPLSTIRTLLGELRREHSGDTTLAADIELLAGQAERCRDILRELVTVGRQQLAGNAQEMTLEELGESIREALRLLRPEIEIEHDTDPQLAERVIQVVPALRHALINLLNNAADASIAAGSTRIALHIVGNRQSAEFRIRDFGEGISATLQRPAGSRFQSSKRDGLGLGLALANATAERFGGELTAQSASGGGIVQCLRLPLATLDNPPHVR